MSDLILYSLLVFAIAQTLLLIAFLLGFYKLRALISPLIDKFAPKGGLKMPTIKEAIGYGLAKLIDSVDFGKFMGGMQK